MGFDFLNDRDFRLIAIVVVLTVSLNAGHICTTVDTVSANALLVFVCYSFYFALLGSRLRYRPKAVIAASVVIFSFIGLVIGLHFSIAPIYGISFGVFQGLVIPLLLWPVSIVWSPDSLVWLLSVVSVWTSMDSLVASAYGIAVTLPIQLYRFPLLLQPISLFGFASLDAFVIACNCILATFFLSFTSESVRVLRALPLVRLFLLVGMWLILSNALWYSFDGDEENSAIIATISPGYRFNGNLTDMLNMTKTAASNDAKYIVWPELYIQSPSLNETCQEYIAREIVPEIASLGIYLVVGCYQRLLDTHCADANLAITLGPGGTVLGTYGKEHPVTMIGEQSCFTNGYHAYPMSEESLSFSTLICYDMDFSDSPSKVTDLNVSLILNPSEDWSSARGHFSASVFRAVENRVAVAKCDWGWDSAIIDPLGRILSIYDTESIHREILSANVPLFSKDNEWNYSRQLILPILFIFASIVVSILSVKRIRFGETDLQTSLLG